MSVRSLVLACLAAFVLAACAIVPEARAQRSQADCAPGWIFRNGQCEQPGAGGGGGNNDAACQATAEYRYCYNSAYVGCNYNRNVFACRLLQLAQGNPGQFQQIMNAQRACLSGNPQACAFLQQFKGLYF